MAAISFARQYFYQEIHKPDHQLDLARAALYIAQEEYPQIQVDEYLNALDTMAAELRDRLPSELYPLRIIRALNQYLYDDLGFSGNSANYYDHRNSYLNQVIDRRLGIPITLSLVYIELARRIDFPMVGIGMPGHFLIRPDVAEMELFVDPFNNGEVLFWEDCQTRLQAIYGDMAKLRPEFLRTIDPRSFLVRMLTNLKFIYLNREDLTRSLAVMDRILLIYPEAPTELRDRGLLHYQLQHWIESRQDLEQYLQLVPDAQDQTLIRQLLSRIS